MANVLGMMIARWKKYRSDWVDKSITEEHFPVDIALYTTEGVREVSISPAATMAQVLAHLDAQGLVPARLEHLLAWGEAHPDRDPLVALGSVWVDELGCTRFPAFVESQDEQANRELDLCYRPPEEEAWSPGWTFLAVSK